MQTYISQLIEDIHTSIEHAKRSINKKLIEESFEAHIIEFERFMRDEGKQPIHEIISIHHDCFPPVERLTSEQSKNVVQALTECLYSWNICIDMPEKIPATLAYTLTVNALKEEVVIVSSGFIHMELCNYDSAFCPFGIEYCRCIDSEVDDTETTDSIQK